MHLGHLTITPAFLHEGAIRTAVHALKYQGVDPIVAAVAAPVAANVPHWASALVPIPRSWARRRRYGIDQAAVIARSIGGLTGLPVIRALRAPVIRQSRLTGRHTQNIWFRRVCHIPPGAVLVDDVVTTGVTLGAAAEAGLGAIRGAVTVTRSMAG